MSRIGKKSIFIPQGIEVVYEDSCLKIEGPKGVLSLRVHPTMDVVVSTNVLNIVPKKDIKEYRRYHGLTRSLVNNMVIGVSEGFSKELQLVGVGYRAIAKGELIILALGYSHPLEYRVPLGVKIRIDKQTTLVISGIDKEVVGEAAAKIRSMRPPEPYHGKGIKYADEVIVRKAGKASSKK